MGGVGKSQKKNHESKKKREKRKEIVRRRKERNAEGVHRKKQFVQKQMAFLWENLNPEDFLDPKTDLAFL